MGAKSKSAASWSSVKAKLGAFDRMGLLGLLQDLYAANKDNQAFLHHLTFLIDTIVEAEQLAQRKEANCSPCLSAPLFFMQMSSETCRSDFSGYRPP
jgi:hypothetical protein